MVCSQLKKNTKLKTCEKRGKVRNSSLTEIKVAVSHMEKIMLLVKSILDF